MAPGDPRPGDEPRQGRNRQQQLVGAPVAHQGGQEAGQPYERGGHQSVERHLVAAQPREEVRGVTALGQGEEHAGGGVQAGCPRREHRGENDGVHEAGRPQYTGTIEDQREGTDRDVLLRGVEQVGVGVGDEEADNGDRPDVEQQDSPEDRADRSGNCCLGVLGLAGGGADELGALEGVAGYQEHQQDPLAAVHEGGLVDRPVAGARRLAQDSNDHDHTEYEEDDHGHDLDGREPELALTVGPRGQGVDAEQDEQEQAGPHDRGHVRQPVLHHQCGRHQLGRHCDRPVEPVVPADGEPEGRRDEARAVLAERPGHRQVGCHLAQRLHNEPHHEADDRVSH